MNFVMHPNSDFEVKTKPIVGYDLEKLANKMLSDANIDNIANTRCNERNVHQEELPQRDSNFWNSLLKANDCLKGKLVIGNSPQLKLAMLDTKTEGNEFTADSLKLVEKCFVQWKTYMQTKIKQRNLLAKQIEEKKFDNFFKMLKKHQDKKFKRCSLQVPTKIYLSKYGTERPVQGTVEFEDASKMSSKTSKVTESACFKHRFQTQQDIIRLQKDKLIKQEKIIEQLKLGKLSEEINQSIKETRKEIHETLVNCSFRVKCKVAPPCFENDQASSIGFYVQSSKAPKIVQQMEKRALERAHKRQKIKERKQLLDQHKKETIEREIERKKALDEEERRKNLREMKEKRKRELEIQRRIQINKQTFMENYAKAELFHKLKLVKLGFKGFQQILVIKENNVVTSRTFYATNLLRKSLQKWIGLVVEKEFEKLYKAEKFYNYRLKEKMFRLLLYARMESVQHSQVAEDLHDMRLQSKTFIHWHRYTCAQYILENKNIQIACKHYINRILLNYFYQWKMLPTIMKLEKAKEEKKCRWRQRVWEILPDYKPMVDD